MSAWTRARGEQIRAAGTALTAQQRDQAVASLRTIGGVYDLIALVVLHEHRGAR